MMYLLFLFYPRSRERWFGGSRRGRPWARAPRKASAPASEHRTRIGPRISEIGTSDIGHRARHIWTHKKYRVSDSSRQTMDIEQRKASDIGHGQHRMDQIRYTSLGITRWNHRKSDTEHQAHDIPDDGHRRLDITHWTPSIGQLALDIDRIIWHRTHGDAIVNASNTRHIHCPYRTSDVGHQRGVNS